MAKRLRARDKLLLGAAILADISSQVFEPLSIQIGKLKGTLPPDYGYTNFAQTVSRMLRTGDLEKIIKNGEPYLRITGAGKKKLVRDFPIFSLRPKRWDKIWRIIFYDIPEKQHPSRERLEKKLEELGFGMVQESVYISPFDVVEDLWEFLIGQGLEDYVFISEAKQLHSKNTKDLVNRIWRLEKINDRYISLYQKISHKEKLNEIFAEYEEILKDDPCLPSDLLPEDWMGEKVHQEIKELIMKGEEKEKPSLA
jgi:DNA-binding transcriptional regulator PaaX